MNDRRQTCADQSAASRPRANRPYQSGTEMFHRRKRPSQKRPACCSHPEPKQTAYRIYSDGGTLFASLFHRVSSLVGLPAGPFSVNLCMEAFMGHERCPRCADSLHIVRVKFNWSGTRLLYACPNCAQVQDSSVQKVDPPPEGNRRNSIGGWREAGVARPII